MISLKIGLIAYAPSFHTAWHMEGVVKWMIYEMWVGRGKEKNREEREVGGREGGREEGKGGGRGRGKEREEGVRTCTQAKGI